MLTSANGNRGAVNDVIVVMTDGYATLAQQRTAAEAKELRGAGARVIVVGVGDHIDIGNINEITSDPDNANTFRMPSVDEVESTATAILDSVCQ